MFFMEHLMSTVSNLLHRYGQGIGEHQVQIECHRQGIGTCLSQA